MTVSELAREVGAQEYEVAAWFDLESDYDSNTVLDQNDVKIYLASMSRYREEN